MLNPSFSSRVIDFDESRYVLPPHLIQFVISENTSTSTGRELRLQKVYRVEVWSKLNSLGVRPDEFNWNEKEVLEVSCGTGFLAYHLLSKTRPKWMTLNDISLSELDEARKLMDSIKGSSFTNINYFPGDVMESKIESETFDVVIGNSFLHHLYDVPRALSEFRRLLRPGGYFITLHEPTVAAVALESGSFRAVLKYLRYGIGFIDRVRYKGEGISLGGGADVWIFKKDEIVNLVRKAGFEDIVIKNWHLLRPFIVAQRSLHLNQRKLVLSKFEEAVLRGSILIDSALSRFVPSSFFGSFCLSARKPYGNK